MSTLIGILSLLSALAATSYALQCSQCYSIALECSGNKITCPSGEVCGPSNTEGSAGGEKVASLVKSRAFSPECKRLGSMSVQQEKVRMITSCCYNNDCPLNHPQCERMAEDLARACSCSSECNFSGSMSLQQVQIRMGTSCYSSTANCSLSDTLPTENSTLNGVVCPFCISSNSTLCYTDDTIQCTGDENMCLLLQSTQESGSMSASTAFRGCATKSFCDLGSQSQNVTGLSTEFKFNCTSGSTTDSTTDSGSTSGSTSLHKVVLTPAIASLVLLKLFF